MSRVLKCVDNADLLLFIIMYDCQLVNTQISKSMLKTESLPDYYYYYLIKFNVRIEPLGYGRLIIHVFVTLVAPLRSIFA